jgi:hypothetical protein
MMISSPKCLIACIRIFLTDLLSQFQSALCRAALPQTPVLLSRMGANCPAAVPCLLDGCIAVYCQSIAESSALHNNLSNASSSSTSSSHQLSNIASACVQSVRLLAKLSPREAHRTMSTLRHRNVMYELQLELMMQHDALSAFMFVNQHLSVDAAISSAKEVESLTQPITTVSGHLQQNASLLREMLHFINAHLSVEYIPTARHSITLSSYIRILSQVSMTAIFVDDGIEILLGILASLRRKLEVLREDVAKNLQKPEVPSSGQEYNLLIAAIVSTYAVLFSDNKFLESNTGAQLKDLIDMNVAPLYARVFLVRLSLSLFYGGDDSLYDVVDASVIRFTTRQALSTKTQKTYHFRTLLQNLCTWVVNLSGLNDECIDREYVLLHPSIAIQLLKYKQSAVLPASDLFLRVLEDTEAVLRFLQDPLVLEFVEISVSIVLYQKGAKLPLVSPVQMHTLASTLLLSQWENLEIPVLKFLIQLLYCFYFFEHASSSPFRINPRELPLNRILELGERFEVSRRIHSIVLVKLAYFIDKYCPEVQRFHRFKTLKSREVWFQKYRPKILVKNKQEFSRILRQAVASISQCDNPGGLAVERTFMEASLYLSDADLMSASVSALISSSASLPLCFTYPMLYRDPLVVLKCPLIVWNCQGTRRVALTVLSSLLVTNEFIVRGDAVCQEAANELLSSRNATVLRSLLRVMTSTSATLERSALVCAQTCGLIRRVVASNEGLGALLIKQGLTTAEIDWLTESVPELALDLSTIQRMLTDKNSLSAANRLVVAECCVWIAIAHGHRLDDYAEAIVHACLSQLISSFFLILGPIGVPVNALLGQGTDLDATQIARKAAFRLLAALRKITLFRTQLKGETLSMLQKFLGMCKGESIVGSFQTSITGSQKILLKDLVESVRKAMESMGLTSNTPD